MFSLTTSAEMLFQWRNCSRIFLIAASSVERLSPMDRFCYGGALNIYNIFVVRHYAFSSASIIFATEGIGIAPHVLGATFATSCMNIALFQVSYHQSLLRWTKAWHYLYRNQSHSSYISGHYELWFKEPISYVRLAVSSRRLHVWLISLDPMYCTWLCMVRNIFHFQYKEWACQGHFGGCDLSLWWRFYLFINFFNRKLSIWKIWVLSLSRRCI